MEERAQRQKELKAAREQRQRETEEQARRDKDEAQRRELEAIEDAKRQKAKQKQLELLQAKVRIDTPLSFFINLSW